MVQMCQQWRSTEDSVTDEQRVAENHRRLAVEIDRVRSVNEEIEQTEESIDNHSFRHPIMRSHMALFLKLASRIDRDIIVSHPEFNRSHSEALGVSRETPEQWKKKVIKLAMQDIPGCDSLRTLLLDIWNGRDDPLKHKWSVRESMFRRREDAKERGKSDEFLEDPLWVLSDTVLSSLRSKLKTKESNKKNQLTQRTGESLEYDICGCNNLYESLKLNITGGTETRCCASHHLKSI